MPEQEEELTVGARLVIHEKVCAERYLSIIERIKTLERVMWGVAAVICTVFLGLLVVKLQQPSYYELPIPPSLAEPHHPTISR